MVEIGLRFPMTDVECEGVEACKSADPVFELGKIYEVEVDLSGTASLSDGDAAERLYDAIKSLRREYPGIGINYAYVSNDGSKVIVQMFDPQEKLLVYKVIIVLALILGILFVSYKIINMVIRSVAAFAMEFRGFLIQVPWWVWAAVAVAAVSVSIAATVKR